MILGSNSKGVNMLRIAYAVVLPHTSLVPSVPWTWYYKNENKNKAKNKKGFINAPAFTRNFLVLSSVCVGSQFHRYARDPLVYFDEPTEQALI